VAVLSGDVVDVDFAVYQLKSFSAFSAFSAVKGF